MPLARGSAFCGYVSMLGAFLAAGAPVQATMPKVGGLHSCFLAWQIGRPSLAAACRGWPAAALTQPTSFDPFVCIPFSVYRATRLTGRQFLSPALSAS